MDFKNFINQQINLINEQQNKFEKLEKHNSKKHELLKSNIIRKKEEFKKRKLDNTSLFNQIRKK